MGWKSTVDISRKTAIELIQKHLLNASNKELEEANLLILAKTHKAVKQAFQSAKR